MGGVEGSVQIDIAARTNVKIHTISRHSLLWLLVAGQRKDEQEVGVADPASQWKPHATENPLTGLRTDELGDELYVEPGCAVKPCPFGRGDVASAGLA
jgi:hypothetical protein